MAIHLKIMIQEIIEDLLETLARSLILEDHQFVEFGLIIFQSSYFCALDLESDDYRLSKRGLIDILKHFNYYFGDHMYSKLIGCIFNVFLNENEDRGKLLINFIRLMENMNTFEFFFLKKYIDIEDRDHSIFKDLPYGYISLYFFKKFLTFIDDDNIEELGFFF